MKKYKKFLALLLAALLCLSLCGCVDLDAMRSEHAVWQEDGSILWNGAVYRKLENVVDMDEMEFSYSYVTIYVTQPDVPVLLSDTLGDPYDVFADGTILGYYDYRLAEVRYTWYCREDVYDETVAMLEKGVQLNTYCYYYWDSTQQLNVKYYLTEEQANAIRHVLATVTPVHSDGLEEPIMDEIYLYASDENHLFEQGAERLFITESGYCILSYEYVYVVPMEYNRIFDEIWKAYNESVYVYTPPTIVV